MPGFFICSVFDPRQADTPYGATDTGKLLWEVKLPAGGQATPMTYSIGGRQYLVIAAGGYLIAYALLPR